LREIINECGKKHYYHFYSFHHTTNTHTMTTTKRTRSIASTAAVLLLSAQWAPVSSFSATRSSVTVGLNPFAKGQTRPKSDLSVSAFESSVEAHSSKNDNIMKEFERKELVIQKRREEALSKLNEYEESLTQLQSRKDEYMAAPQVAMMPLGGSFSETTLRSAIKSFLWRVVAGTVTFFTTLRFSGSVAVAIKVVASDFLSKAFTMFLGERLMNKSAAGRKGGSDNASRSLVKALTWRLFAIANTLTMAVFISKDLSVASKIASTDAVFKTGLMFAYERVWAKVEWGKEYLVEFSI